MRAGAFFQHYGVLFPRVAALPGCRNFHDGDRLLAARSPATRQGNRMGNRRLPVSDCFLCLYPVVDLL